MSNTELRTIADPLSSTTRVERRWLLVSSVVLVALTWGGLSPTKLNAFGIEINRVNAGVLVGLTCVITAYFLIAFVFYYRADRFAANREAVLEEERLVKTAADSNAHLEVGMTSEAFKDAMGHYLNLQFQRYVYSRYRFEYWSALFAGFGSLASASIWLLMRLLRSG
jgi:hypothetical protein